MSAPRAKAPPLPPSEEALFSVIVSVRKQPGVLTATSRRLVWGDGNAIAMSIAQHVIVEQAVNAATSAKVLLKLTLSEPVADAMEVMLSFDGVHASVDRESVKDYINQVLAARRRESGSSSSSSSSAVTAGVPKTMAGVTAAAAAAPSPAPTTPVARVKTPLSTEVLTARVAALTNNKDLQKLHMELVVGKIVSEEDFWSSRKHIVNRYLPKQAQKKGVPSALHEVHAVDSTTSQRIYTFAPSIIQTIFMQYPAVERAYKDYVPDKLTETDFWKKFVHSRTFYREHERDRRRAAPGEEDLFEKYHREMENAESEVKKRRLDVDLSRDLTATVEDHLEDNGNKPDSSMLGSTNNPTATKLLRHGTLVLRKSMQENPKATINTFDAVAPSKRHDSLLDELMLEDLQAPKTSAEEVLVIKEPTKYFEGSTSTTTASADGKLTEKEIQDSITHTQRIIQMFAGWQPNLPPKALDPSQSESTVLSLLVNERIGGNQPVTAAAMRARALVASQHMAVCEVLRHFWSAFQSTEPHMVRKTQRMVTTLQNLRVKLRELQTDAFSDDPDAMGNLRSLHRQIDHALATYDRRQ